MAVSGSYDFTLTRDDIIREALELTAVIDIGDSTPPELLETCIRSANLLLKSWQAKGLFLHTFREANLFLAKGAQSYLLGPTGDHCTESFIETTLAADVAASAVTITLDSITGMTNGDYIGIVLDDGSLHWTTITDTGGVTIATGPASGATTGNAVYTYTTKIQRPLEISDARYKDADDTERPVIIGSVSEYAALANKTSQGPCVQVAFEPLLDNCKLNTWPVADDVTDHIVFRYKKPADDLDTDSDTLAMPPSWFMAFTLGLAHTIAPKLKVSITDQAGLKQRYDDALRDLDDNENSSFFFSPDFG